MTATRMRLLGGAATLLGLVAAWVVAVLFLWRTQVPADLDVDGFSPRSFFTPRELEETTGYEDFHRINWILATITTLVVFVLYAWRGARFARESAAGPIGTGMLLAMLGFALVWLVELPFTIAGHWWDRRHDVSDAGYLEVVFGGWMLLGFLFLTLSVTVLVVMGFARLIGEWWWIPGAAVFVGILALRIFLSPYLIPDTHELRNPELVQSARVLAEKQGVASVLPVRVQDVEDLTNAPNAFAVGLGSTRRVFLWSTLLDGRFRDDEVEFVISHEFAHHARAHLPKAIAWYALFLVPMAVLIAVATRRRGGMGRPEAVPLALLLVVVVNLAKTPVENAVSRRMEAEADWSALQATRDPDAGKRLFQGFSEEALHDPDPPTWAYLMFASHPTLMQRIAMTEQWKRRNGG